MIKYKKTYLEAFRLDPEDFIPCELTGQRAVDFHHIVNRYDRIENLMALTREKHIQYGDKKKHMVYLLEMHRIYLRSNKIEFDNAWFIKWIDHYKHINE